MIDSVLAAVEAAADPESSESSDYWIKVLTPCSDPTLNQFVVFLKPEVTAARSGVRTDDILTLLLSMLDRWRVVIQGIRVLSPNYLKHYRVMDGHYGVINSLSRRGAAGLTTDSGAALGARFARELDEGAEIVGAHEFLARVPALSPMALALLSDNLGTVKVAPGTYCIKVRLQGKTFLILSPFHPHQLEDYITPGSAVVAFGCSSQTRWRELREQLAGATDPTRATPGSFRNTLLTCKVDLGLPEVSQGKNGMHLSAGPLEGMVELKRFFPDAQEGTGVAWTHTCFGQLLAQHGLSDEAIAQLAGNPVLNVRGRDASAFDATEDMDAEAAAALFAECIGTS